MDLKGISWVGNIYQKFEAMCLEVEEIVYQDTVKYVENQVQTVGSSVKKFYSEVMEDLLPPSSVDAGKGAACDVPLELYADVGIYMKPKVGVKEKPGKFDDREKLSEDSKIAVDKNSDDLPAFHTHSLVENMLPVSQRDFIGGASRQHGKRSTSNKSNPITKKTSKRESMSLKKKSGTITRFDEDMTRASSFCEPSNANVGDSAGGASKQFSDGCLSRDSGLGSKQSSERKTMSPDENTRVLIPSYSDLTTAHSVCEVSSEKYKESVEQKATLGSIEVTGHDSIDESKYETENATNEIPDVHVDGALSDMINSIESDMSKEMQMAPTSHGSLAAEANAADDCMRNRVDFPEESFANMKMQSTEISEEDFVTNSVMPDECSTDGKEVDFCIDHEMEIIQQVDGAKLEESCILVSGDECYIVAQNEGKNKSYKKKIRDVFSPRKRSVRKQEYEQLLARPGSDSNPNQEECTENSMPSRTTIDAKRTSSLDFCESEWELL